jgi:type IV secretion system protein VirB11
MKRQLGPFCALLTEPGLVELMLNADGTVWADRMGSGMSPVGQMHRASAESFIGTVASVLRGTITRENPILECELPAGSEGPSIRKRTLRNAPEGDFCGRAG